jgi:serine/threonine protein kinase
MIELVSIDLDTIDINIGTCESDMDGDDDSDSDITDDRGIESTIFQLSTHFIFVRRIHKHEHVGVYEALEKVPNGRRCCIKIQYKDTDRIPIEVRILCHINQTCNETAHFPVLMNYFEYNNMYVIVTQMEVENSMSCLFKNEHSTQAMLTQLIQSVILLHRAQIIYRDMKISNILWDEKKQHLVLCDFNLSTFNTAAGHTSILGTDGYMSPEQTIFEVSPPLTDEPPEPYKTSIDIYGIGAVLGTILNRTLENDLEVDSVHLWRKKLLLVPSTNKFDILFMGLTDPCKKKRMSLEHALCILVA